MDEDMNQDEPVIGDAPPQDKVLLSNSVYDKLMPIAQLWLPALAVFYITIAPLWGLPKQEEVAGTIMAVNLLLGAVLGVSNKQYQNSEGRFDGAINVESFEDEGYSNLNVQLDPAAIAGKDEVTVKVNRA
jgi:hypothetical protein